MDALVIGFAIVISALLVREEVVKHTGTPGPIRHGWTLPLLWAAGGAVGTTSLYDALLVGRRPAMPAFVAACVLLAAGTVVRRRAKVDLGDSWNLQIAVREDQRVIDSGTYAVVRHPAYVGLMLQLLAFPLGTGSRIGFLLALGVAVPALLLRSWLEDRELTRALHGYAAYRAATPAYLPVRGRRTRAPSRGST